MDPHEIVPWEKGKLSKFFLLNWGYTIPLCVTRISGIFQIHEIYSFPNPFPCSLFQSIATILWPFTCAASSEAR